LIIDSHVHICEPPYTQDKLYLKIADGTVLDMELTRADNSVDRLLQDMDECHINKALIMANEFTSNEFLSNVVKTHPKRLVGFARVTNPRGNQSMAELEKAVNELGLKGLKLHPGTQAITPIDQKVLPLIKRAAELNVPILIHTGGWPPGYFRYCLVEHIDTLKKKVPKATLIIGHMGLQRFLDLLSILPFSQGVYAEISWGLTMIADLFGIDFATRFIRKIGVNNVVFGSDWVGTNNEMKAQLSTIEKMSLTREERNKILGENIRKILDGKI